MDDIATYIELAEEENDPEMLPEIEALFTDFDTSMDNIRVKTLLSGEYDANNAIVGLHAAPAARRPATGFPCSTGCTPVGPRAGDMRWKCWIIWTARRRASSP